VQDLYVHVGLSWTRRAYSTSSIPPIYINVQRDSMTVKYIPTAVERHSPRNYGILNRSDLNSSYGSARGRPTCLSGYIRLTSAYIYAGRLTESDHARALYIIQPIYRPTYVFAYTPTGVIEQFISASRPTNGH